MLQHRLRGLAILGLSTASGDLTMKRIFDYCMISLAAIACAVIVNACGSGSSSASDTLTQAQFDSMLASSAAFKTLQTQVAAIPSPAVYIKAPNAPSIQMVRRTTESVGGGSTQAQTAALPSPCTWTLTGRPTSSDPLQSNIYSGVSCTGYYFDISGAATASDQGIIQGLVGAEIDFDGTNCTGNAYVRAVPQTAIVNGFVFGLNPQDPGFQGTDPSNPAYYWYVPAGETPTTVQSLSMWRNGAGCSNNPSVAALNEAYPILPNDSSVTGIPSAPVPGPVLISN